jgi:hypothetical protein
MAKGWQFEGRKTHTRVIRRRAWPEENNSRDQSPQLECYGSIKNSRRAIRGADNHSLNIIEALKTLGN